MEEFYSRGDAEVDGFPSDCDNEPVDMEEVREGMKQVPLPDMYCYTPDAADMNFQDDEPENVEAPENDDTKLQEEKRRPKAAKMAAANVAPNVLTGGAVAETGPPPDFSVWTAEDDLLLKNAIEAGAAMEALAKGAMRFSRRYTVKELRERWRALLYDPPISTKAAVRMVESEAAFLESMRRMFPNKRKFQDFVQKRREKSVRASYYKRKSSAAEAAGVQPGAEPETTPNETLQRSSSSNAGVANGAEESDEVCEVLAKPAAVDPGGAGTSATGPKVTRPPEVFVLSSDEDDEPDTPEAPKPGVRVEQMVCTFNTEEKDVPLFEESWMQEGGSDDDKYDVTSDFRAPEPMERQEQQQMATKELSLPSDNLCFKISLAGKRGMAFDQDRTKTKAPAAEVGKSLQLPEVLPPAAAPSLPSPMVSPTVTPEVASSAALIDSAVKEVEQPVVSGADSDEEFASFSDVEAMVLDMDLDPGDDDVSARAESKLIYKKNRKAILRLEQAANASLQRTLNAKGALAIFYGHRLKYYVTKEEVTVGRSTQDNVVDVDLVKEGPANKVSRKQASIWLKEDGIFYLKNTGRRILHVNNVAIDTGQLVALTSNCLIEVGGMWFIFEMNKKATVHRAKAQSV